MFCFKKNLNLQKKKLFFLLHYYNFFHSLNIKSIYEFQNLQVFITNIIIRKLNG